MIPILLEPDSDRLASRLLQALRQTDQVMKVEKNTFDLQKNPHFALISYWPQTLQAEAGILIAQNGLIRCAPRLMGEFIAVVNADSEDAMDFAAGSGLPAITCGLSARDSLTVSSIDPDSALVTLQRSIVSMDGSLLEPQEIPVSLVDSIDPFELLSICAVYLLTGRSGNLLEITI